MTKVALVCARQAKNLSPEKGTDKGSITGEKV